MVFRSDTPDMGSIPCAGMTRIRCRGFRITLRSLSPGAVTNTTDLGHPHGQGKNGSLTDAGQEAPDLVPGLRTDPE